ncbi:MAG: gamma-glutamyl-gamma-aminobutyrate hydrolase family protein [Negativicutes bacterium]|nr:gamma-glutamyl-gamma-aminobutyrate hydrolase family protein [Negativicutes bacterium]
MSNDRPLILISPAVTSDPDQLWPRPERIYLNCGYYRAVTAAGGLPLVLPPVGECGAEQAAELCHGLLLSGGGDLMPCWYGQQPHWQLGEVCPERDRLEIALVRAMVARGKPVLGICRGMQVLNVALGGDIHQDIASDARYFVQHRQRAKGHVGTHDLQIAAGSVLFRLSGEERQVVNSFHHQAVDRLAAGLRPVAWSADGLVEAVEDEQRLLLAVQWHPERMAEHHILSQRLFVWLCEQARAAGG